MAGSVPAQKLNGFLLFAFNIFLFISIAFSVKTPPVKTWLKTSWDAPDLLLGIIESVAIENSSAYFPLISELISTDFGPHPTQKEFYEKTLQVIETKNYLSAPAVISALEFALALHTTAPTIQAYYQYYNTSVLPEKLDDGNASSFNQECDVWADWYGHQACTIEELKQIAGITKDDIKSQIVFDSKKEKVPKLLPFDHILQPKLFSTGAKTEPPIIVLYFVDLLSPTFAEFHKFLIELVENISAIYVLRYKPPQRTHEFLYLSGYGVELALKSTDYIVIDDRKVETDHRQGQESEANESHTSKDDKVDKHLFDEEISEIKPLKVAEIEDLGVKAAQFILCSQNPLAALVHLSQDFPKYSHAIAQLTLNESIRQEISQNQKTHIIPGENTFWINGMPIPASDVDPFSLQRVLRRERQTVLSLNNLGLSYSQAIDLLTSPKIAEVKPEDDPLKGHFDVREKFPDAVAVVWRNDLEKDDRYTDWPARINELLRPVFPGQMRAVRKNLFSALYIVDLSTIDGLRMVDEARTFIERDVPIRFGLVPLFGEENNDSIIMARLFYYFTGQYDRDTAFQFLDKVYTDLTKSSSSIADIARQKFDIIVKPEDGNITTSFDEVIKESSFVESKINSAADLINRFRLKHGGPAMFVNGKYFEIDELYQRNLVITVSEHTLFLQQKVYYGEIDDSTDVYDFFMSLPSIPSRRNPHIIVSEAQPLKVIENFDVFDIDQLGYIYSENQTSSVVPTSIWVVADFDNPHGIQQGLDALEFLENSENIRLTFIHNPSSTNPHQGLSASLLIYRILHEKEVPLSSEIKNSLKEAFKEIAAKDLKDQMHITDQVEESDNAYLLGIEDLNIGKTAGWQTVDKLKADSFWNDLIPLVKDSLKLQGGAGAIVINGRIVGPLVQEIFTFEDLDLLAQMELHERIDPVVQAVKSFDIELNDTKYSDFIFKVCTIISASTISDVPPGFSNSEEVKRDRSYLALQGEYSRVLIGDLNTALYQIAVVIDPLSETAQKWSAILETLSAIQGVYIHLSINPHTQLTEVPLTRFYRYVLEPKLKFDEKTGNPIPFSASFSGLPEKPLLTLGMDVIQAWLVTPKVSVHDLDNIRLATLDSNWRRKGVEAVFELKNILIEGHARDVTLNTPPRGLQLIFGSKSNPALVDTIVMANLGYFQLKANPGVWDLGLREGKSTEIFEIESVGGEGWYSRNVQEIGTDIFLKSFEGVLIYPRVKRKPGKETEDILGSSTASDESIWGFIKSKISSHNKDKAEINIFSVASGHLYERFLSIMIISVLRHTKLKVKFWFIENFLSPSFKDFIPHMAKEYKFDYELVTYKWPHWLRKQKEKQRTIWGYKILFLDVLFPLDLDKVIFVDADQIVRVDLKELVDMDLHGAPYGYTPFCDDRPEIDGFRFWKEGYWKEHLQGKPYHISALYVIDLQKFRHMAAGDRLRGQYQVLSADPNSLANLDQDLPNNMQHTVPIFSLPQEWLWCETWCSDESLAKAKTIDLCNNPMTKEPKLDRAKRQVPEWESYDNEAAAFAAEISQKTKSFNTEEVVVGGEEKQSEQGNALKTESKHTLTVATTTSERIFTTRKPWDRVEL